MSVAFAVLRWVARTEIAAAVTGPGEAAKIHRITIGMPKPSRKLKAALAARVARYPALHALCSLGVAALLVLVAISPSGPSMVGDVIGYPWHIMDNVVSQFFDWVLDRF